MSKYIVVITKANMYTNYAVFVITRVIWWEVIILHITKMLIIVYQYIMIILLSTLNDFRRRLIKMRTVLFYKLKL